MKGKVAMAAFLLAALMAGSLTAIAGTGAASKQSVKPKTEQAEKENKVHQKQGRENEAAEQAALAKQARITMDKAREIALKHTPGTVASSELEREHGKLVYSFDIRTAKNIAEVQVSAINGKIVRVERESFKKEAAEKRKEG